MLDSRPSLGACFTYLRLLGAAVAALLLHCCSRCRACAAVRWLALVLFLLALTPCAQPMSRPPGPPAAAKAAEAECYPYILGGRGGILRAGMRCTGPKPTVALALPHLAAYQANFTGVAVVDSCGATPTADTPCLVTVCAGRLVLRHSSATWVPRLPLEGVVCVVKDSTMKVHNSRFSRNLVRPLAVFDQAQLLLNASAVHNNSIKGSGGGLLMAEGARVTISGRSKVHGNNATEDGGGLVARGNAVLTVIGNSSVRDNSAGLSGGGLVAFGGPPLTVSVELSGSSLQGNTARNGPGGGLAVFDKVECELNNNTRMHLNRAATVGGGLFAANNTRVSVWDSNVNHNTAGANGGGVAAFGASVVRVLEGSGVNNNTAAGSGGGIFVCEVAHVGIDGYCSVRGNIARNGSGGGLVVWDRSNVLLLNGSLVADNTAKESGGGLQVVGNARVEVTGSGVIANVADKYGGGLDVLGNATIKLMLESSVYNNTAQLSGGGLHVDGNASVTFDNACRVNNNKAAVGGGLDAGSGARVVFTGDCKVVSNTAR